MREIIIRTCLNGYIVQVGCQTVVFEDKNKLMSELFSYLTEPEATEKRYLSLPNAKYTGPVGPMPQQEQAYATDQNELRLNNMAAGTRCGG